MAKRYSYQIVLTILILVTGLFQVYVAEGQAKSLSQTILDKIYDDKDLSHFTIEVSDSVFSVTLRGEVATEKQKKEIIKIASEFIGERKIEDQILISKDKFGVIDVSDEQIKSNIRDILSQEKVTNTSYTVAEGLVTISGDFSTFREVDSLFSLVQTVAGVKRIISNATVNGKAYMQEFKQFKKGDK